MQDTYNRNDDEYVRAGGPYAGLIRELVENGRYGSAAEVVLDALSLLRDRELLLKAKEDWLKAEVQKGVDSADRSELLPAEEVFDRLEAKYRAMAEKQEKT
ncbi:MAG: ribbon-helix-helix domain-containing protein [Hyphomicrobiaceae bacterium]